MTEVQNEHDEPIMLPGADKAVASNALLPELAERALEPCADLPRVIEFPDSLAEKLENAAGDRFIRLIEFSLRRGLNLKRPVLCRGQSGALLFRVEWSGYGPSARLSAASRRGKSLRARRDVEGLLRARSMSWCGR